MLAIALLAVAAVGYFWPCAPRAQGGVHPTENDL
jgi:hypothetical protein